MVFLRAAAIALLLPICCSARQPEAIAKGTVTGRVVCADTNLPARKAHVVLQPVVDNTTVTKGTSPTSSKRLSTTTLVETLLDGSFTIPNVSPGNYYVFVERLGYLSPLALLSREDLNHPTPQTAILIARLLTPVSVAPNRVSNVEVRIFKGATISGTVRFDDGSPNVNASIELLTKDGSGKWIPFRTRPLGSQGLDSTDDLGHYRISGLPSGEYLIKTNLALSDIVIDRVYGQVHLYQNSTKYSLGIYFADGLRESDAKPVKVEEGEESSSANISIPISKLHGVSGSVVEASTGQAINAGSIALVYSDGTELVSAEIDRDDRAFHFYFVPEGQYTLKSTHIREVSSEVLSSGPEGMTFTYTNEKKLRDYDAPPQPIIIHGDMTGITIQAQPRPANSPAKSQ